MIARSMVLFLAIFYCAHLEAQKMPDLIPYRLKDKWGYCDSNKKILITPRWDEAKLFYNNKAIVKKGRDFCLINTDGTYIIPPSRHWNGKLRGKALDNSFNFRTIDGRWGFIDSANNELIAARYDSCSYDGWGKFCFRGPLKITYMIAGINHKQGVLCADGKVLLPFCYDTITEHYKFPIAQLPGFDTSTYFRVKKDNRYGLVDTGNNIKIPIAYRFLNVLQVSSVKQPGSYDSVFIKHCWYAKNDIGAGVVNENNETVFPLRYDSVCYGFWNSHSGFYFLKNNKWGFSTYPGKFAIPPVMDYIPIYVYSNADGSYKLQSDDGYAYMNAAFTKYVHTRDIDFVIDKHGNVKGYQYIMKADGQYNHMTGRLNKHTFKPAGKWGKVKIKYSGYNMLPIPDDVGFTCGYQNFTPDRPRPYSTIGMTRYDDIFIIEGAGYNVNEVITGKNGKTNNYIVSAQQKYGVADEAGNFVIRPQSKYKLIGGYMNNNVLIAAKDSLYGLVDTNMNTLLPFQKLPIVQPFKYRNVYYAFADRNIQKAARAIMHPDDWFAWQLTVIDNKGNEVPAFHNKVILSNPYGFAPMHTYSRTDPITLTDSAGNVGHMTPDGTILQPALGFKYRSVEKITPDIFHAYSRLSSFLIDSANNQLFKGLTLNNITDTYYKRDFGDIESLADTMQMRDYKGLLKANYYNETTGKYIDFYVGACYGIYADDIEKN